MRLQRGDAEEADGQHQHGHQHLDQAHAGLPAGVKPALRGAPGAQTRGSMRCHGQVPVVGAAAETIDPAAMLMTMTLLLESAVVQTVATVPLYRLELDEVAL